MVGVRDIRDINQTLFLQLIRDRQPISRAEISKHTGLRPGTVSAVVTRLIKAGLVLEGTEGPSTGGRRPTHLFVNAESLYVLGVDIGVTDTAIAVSDFNGNIVHRTGIPTLRDPYEFLERLTDALYHLIDEQYRSANVAAIGVSVPGLIDRVTGTIVISPNLGWVGVDIRNFLERRLRRSVCIENDANAAALSEFWYDPLADPKEGSLLFVLVVEGLGTGLILNGNLNTGSRHGVGGFGHMIMDPTGDQCSCGRRGCWETLASEWATLDRYRRLRHSDGPELSMTGLIDAANSGDKTAIAAIVVTAEYLGEGIANLVHGIFPAAVVVGGQITKAWHLIEPVIREKLQSRYIVAPEQIVIRPAGSERPSLNGSIPLALQSCL